MEAKQKNRIFFNHFLYFFLSFLFIEEVYFFSLILFDVLSHIESLLIFLVGVLVLVLLLLLVLFVLLAVLRHVHVFCWRLGFSVGRFFGFYFMLALLGRRFGLRRWLLFDFFGQRLVSIMKIRVNQVYLNIDLNLQLVEPVFGCLLIRLSIFIQKTLFYHSLLFGSLEVTNKLIIELK